MLAEIFDTLMLMILVVKVVINRSHGGKDLHCVHKAWSRLVYTLEVQSQWVASNPATVLGIDLKSISLRVSVS